MESAKQLVAETTEATQEEFQNDIREQVIKGIREEVRKLIRQQVEQKVRQEVEKLKKEIKREWYLNMANMMMTAAHDGDKMAMMSSSFETQASESTQ